MLRDFGGGSVALCESRWSGAGPGASLVAGRSDRAAAGTPADTATAGAVAGSARTGRPARRARPGRSRGQLAGTDAIPAADRCEPAGRAHFSLAKCAFFAQNNQKLL